MGQLNRFESIDNLITFLNNTKVQLDKFFNSLSGKTQEEVDKACIKISTILNSSVNSKKKTLVLSLHQKYEALLAQSVLLKAIAEANPTDLGSVISTVKNMIAFFITPYTEILAAITAFPAQIIQLTEAINSLVTYTPPTMTNINFDKFKINVEAPTLSEVQSGTVADAEIDWDSIIG